MYLSCCVWAITGPEEKVLEEMAALGFEWLDIQAQMLATPALQKQARNAGLRVSSVGASWQMPDGAALDSPDPAARQTALAHVERTLAHCAGLGGSAVYVIPGKDTSPEALARYGESLAAAADAAVEQGLRVCIEHFPDTALPTASATLDFLAGIGHPGLGLLFDIGHVQISGEDPAAVIRQAGARLGYVHLDDNDGQGDLHWALLDGALTKQTLRETFAALADVGYAGAVSLELSPQLPDPSAALARSREIVLECGGKYLQAS